jgi:hypothetical protein
MHQMLMGRQIRDLRKVPKFRFKEHLT